MIFLQKLTISYTSSYDPNYDLNDPIYVLIVLDLRTKNCNLQNPF